jgi:hypothetical protein
MLDDTHEPNRRGEAARDGGRPENVPPLADREVPLASVAAVDQIHRWLDGEGPEPVGLRGDGARSVEFWRQLEEESERRRRVVTPPYVAARIMASLPESASATTVAPWWKKDLHVSPATVVALALGAFSLGMLAMRLLAGG